MSEDILLTAHLSPEAEAALKQHGRLHFLSELTEAALIEQVGDKTALIVRGAAPVTARVIDAAPRLKIIARTGVGYDSVDVAHATARGIPVAYTPGAGSRAVAEAAMTFMLTLVKRLPEWNDGLKRGDWQARYDRQGDDLDGKRLGIIGFGQIGRLLAEMARPFNMCVAAFDPYAPQETLDERGVARVSLDEIYATSDIISLHCPQTPETTGLIDAAAVRAMKRGCYLINLARGGVIESLDVLHDGLTSGQLAGVGLDVFDPAPPDTTHPIFSLPNCVVAPHALATTKGAMDRIFATSVSDVIAVFKGRPPRHLVNLEVLQERVPS
ncbi:hydroxyacid dehydrogenase [Nitratireductor aquibiodomus]|uniref:hydroxyacid dehydrogenase n=1 Tax=Nitratireductor aquibiodomus TaxID=204799 RepID=UPI0019D39C8F|nr:hydroxyacid dehydrogenase [Nitratireductor aquibiodomus]MBN7761571.1 hydroxyacid dehydrogenase [Nitratireductor aquibiodomus]